VVAKMRVAAAVVCIAAALPANADGLYAGATDRVALNVPVDALIIGLGIVGSTVPLVFSGSLARDTCRWCDGPIGTPVNGVDDWFHDRLTATGFSRTQANTMSSVLAYGLMPAAAVGTTLFATGPHATSGAGLRNLVILAETVAVAETLTETIKISTARQRPYVHYQHLGTPGGPPSDLPVPSTEANLSFPSGHTSLVAAVGTSAAMLATLEDSPAAPWLWGATGVATVATGTLRMISESHYLSDVLAGAAIGAACGVLVPLLHRRGSALGGATPVAVPTAGGASFLVTGSF
jgi:membrane-associated phospholipid phosphatase